MIHKLLHKASKLYYEGTPIMSDEEFDSLAKDVSWDTVGYDIGSLEDAIAHTFPLYSLQKHYEENGAWPIVDPNLAITPKLDGASVAITYNNGILTNVLTRGDGKFGLDITDKFLAKNLIPLQISNKTLLQLTGEVVSPKHIPNSRNYASGSLNLKSVVEFVSRELSLVIHGCFPFITDTFTEDMQEIDSLGFTTVMDKYLTFDEFPQDGTVYRIDNNARYLEQGKTSHHPKGSFALKERKEGVQTKLIDVIWQTGKSGVVSPVGILDPINIDGANVAKATLHNIEYIRSLNLEIGCTVEVIRSGDIIPRITRRIEK